MAPISRAFNEVRCKVM